MTIYVDESRWPFRGQLYCHMIADTPDELDAMARRIGLDEGWKQHVGKWNEHYDLAPSMRRRAIGAGAVALTTRALAKMRATRRAATDALLAASGLAGVTSGGHDGD